MRMGSGRHQRAAVPRLNPVTPGFTPCPGFTPGAGWGRHVCGCGGDENRSSTRWMTACHEDKKLQKAASLQGNGSIEEHVGPQQGMREVRGHERPGVSKRRCIRGSTHSSGICNRGSDGVRETEQWWAMSGHQTKKQPKAELVSDWQRPRACEAAEG